jgi:hypothetical protein
MYQYNLELFMKLKKVPKGNEFKLYISLLRRPNRVIKSSQNIFGLEVGIKVFYKKNFAKHFLF